MDDFIGAIPDIEVVIKEIIITALLRARWERIVPDEAITARVDLHAFTKEGSYFAIREIKHPTILLLQVHARLPAPAELVLPVPIAQDLLYVRSKGAVFISDISQGKHRVAVRYGLLHLQQGRFCFRFTTGAYDAMITGPDRRIIDLFSRIDLFRTNETTAFSFYPVHVMDPTSRNLMRQMIHSTLEPPALDLYREAKWLELMSRLILQFKRQAHSASAEVERATREALEHYVEQRLEDNVTVPAMARHFHMSVSALKQRFTRLFHSPIHQYVLRRKLARARQLLQKEELTVYQVALQAGFSDASHFIKRFKKYFGVTPLQYQRMLRK